jgi:hypothetical protein
MYRLVSYLGDKAAPSIIRITLPYMIINNKPDIVANYDYVIHQNESYYTGISALQFQHSCTQNQLEVIKNIKKFKKFKIFYDIDDWILDVPEHNQSFDYFKKHNKTIKQILETVDCIVCSTSTLSKQMSKYNKTTLIKNRLISDLWKTEFDLDELPEKPIILYGGSGYHFSKEGSDFSDDIVDYIIKTSDKYQWTFIGALPLKLKDNKNIVFYPWTTYLNYIYLLKKIKPTVGIALLQDNNFNKCKSNIKALEYTALGIPGVYSNIDPYSDMKCKVTYVNEFIFYIEKLTSDIVFWKDTKNRDYNKLKDSLYWDNSYVNRYLSTYIGG